MSTNPYAAPRAPVADAASVQRGTFLDSGRGVPTGNGWTWIADAWSLFRERAGLLIGMFVVMALIMVALMFIPFIGAIAQSLLWPVFVGGFVIASRKIDEGEPVRFGDLFAGFSQGGGTLIATGLIAMLFSAAIVLAAVGVLGTAFFGAGADLTPAQLMSLAVVSLVMLALLVPLIMALWFAPPLVVFHDMGAWQAMKASFAGCLKNMLPFLLYGIVLTIASVLASIPALLGWLVLGPVVAASIYTSYRDIYFSGA